MSPGMHLRTPRAKGLLAALLVALLGLAAHARAEDPLVLDLPLAERAVLPSWLGVEPDEGAESFALWSARITPIHPEFSLAVTLYCEGTSSGFIRIFWQGDTREELLVSNALENTGAGEQRTVLLSPELLRGGGHLTFQASTRALPIRRIRFDWVHPETLLQNSANPRFALALDHGRVLLREEVDEAAQVPASIEWLRDVVDVPLASKAEPVDGQAGYGFLLPRPAEAGVLHVEVAGIPNDGAMVAWIDGRPAGVLQIEIPSLADTGYLRALDGNLTYYGWRRASLYLRDALLPAGSHTLQLAATGEAPSLRNLRLQIRFAPAAPTPRPQAAPLPAPVLSTAETATQPILLEPDSTLP